MCTVTDQGIHVILSSETPSFIPVQEDHPYSHAFFENGDLQFIENQPVMPVSGQFFRIPSRSGVRLEVLHAEYEIHQVENYAWCLSLDEEGQFGTAVHPENRWYPSTEADIGDPAIFHDFRVCNLTTYPVQINPVTSEVRVCRELELMIHFEGTDNRNTLPEEPTRISSNFLPHYRQFLDWDDSELDRFELYRGSVQVVIPNHNVLITIMEPWFEWKRQKGWTLELLTDEDVGSWTNNAIRNELMERYEEAETPFDYVVIIGDATGSFAVPAGSGDTYSGGDQPYSYIAGNDFITDVGVGRISIENNTEAVTVVNKMLYYERDIFQPDTTDWLGRGLLHISDSFTNWRERYWYLLQTRDQMLNTGYVEVDTLFFMGGNYVSPYLIDGVGFYVQMGWLGTNLMPNNIMSLQNAFCTPVVFDVAEGSGNWCTNLGINEAWFRAGTPGVPYGGICGFGMATSSVHMDMVSIVCQGATEAAFIHHVPALGDLMIASKLNIYRHYFDYDEGRFNNTSQWFNLIGDPTLWYWCGEPQTMFVDLDTTLSIATNTFSVQVSDIDGGYVRDAWVTLYKVDENEEVIATTTTNDLGVAQLQVDAAYPGTAILTVTAQNFAARQFEINVFDPEHGLGYTSYEVIDDNSGGTEGNGNGIAEAGETVGLRFTLHNDGISQENWITVTVSGRDPHILSTEGENTLTILSADHTNECNGIILVELDANTPNRYLSQFDLRIQSNEAVYHDRFEMEIKAPVIELHQQTTDLEYGENDFLIEIENTGESRLFESDYTLYSLDSFLEIAVHADSHAEIDAGQTGLLQFVVDMHPGSALGRTAIMKMEIFAANGLRDTLDFIVQVGSATPEEPSGPDRYGYFAFDNTDEAYPGYAPAYDWIEICPFAEDPDFIGTVLELEDPTLGVDDAILIELPFPVNYYGNEFNNATVCTNGWIALGDELQYPFMKSRVIPGTVGPSNMIAPYWSDMFTVPESNSSVVTYYDEEGGRFIVEWYRMISGSYWTLDHEFTFQVVFYNQTSHPASDGSTVFDFQYGLVEHTSQMGYENWYWTTGIENGRQDDGLMLAYFNTYAPGADSIADGRAIRFTTDIADITGNIEGSLTDNATGSPLEGSIILPGIGETPTDEAGYFLITDIPAITYDLIAVAPYYNPRFVDHVVIPQNNTVEYDIRLLHPEFLLDHTSFSDTLSENEEMDHVIIVQNDGDGILDFAVSIRPVEPGLDTNPSDENSGDVPVDDYELEPVFTITDRETNPHGVVYDGRFFWITGSNGDDAVGPNKIYQYGSNGYLVATCNQPVPAELRTAEGFHELVWDGEFFYGCENNILFRMRFRDQRFVVDSTTELIIDDVRYLTYDPAHRVLWLGNSEATLMTLDHEGNQQQVTSISDFSLQAMGWMPDDPDHHPLYMITQELEGGPAYLHKMEPVNHDLVLVSELDNADEELLQSASITSAVDRRNWMLFTVIQSPAGNCLEYIILQPRSDWLFMDISQITIPGGSSTTVPFTVRNPGLEDGVYELMIHFDHNARPDNPANVHVQIIAAASDAPNPGENELPMEWSFGPVYPNPFNPVTNIPYSLVQQTAVNVKVYDLMGREVASLVNEEQVAGDYMVQWNGEHLASGMYFIKINAGPMQETVKVLLIK